MRVFQHSSTLKHPPLLTCCLVSVPLGISFPLRLLHHQRSSIAACTTLAAARESSCTTWNQIVQSAAWEVSESRRPFSWPPMFSRSHSGFRFVGSIHRRRPLHCQHRHRCHQKGYTLSQSKAGRICSGALSCSWLPTTRWMRSHCRRAACGEDMAGD